MIDSDVNDDYLEDMDDTLQDDALDREPENITANEFDCALRGLILLSDDTQTSMQATNIAVVDRFIMPLESATHLSGSR